MQANLLRRLPMRRLLACLITLTLSVPATACEWDYDTLQMERERFPGALELIVGKFLRHSEPFYEWRVSDRRADLAAHESGERGQEEYVPHDEPPPFGQRP